MMSDGIAQSIADCFSDLKDPRVAGRCDHKLLDRVLIAICGVICGADSWVGVETFGKAKANRLGQELELKNGIPSHDSFGRLFVLLDADEFQKAFMRWVAAVFAVTSGQVIASDGKTVRRSPERTLGKEAIHMVSAWDCAPGIVLGQRKVDSKTNEITVLPELLRLLAVAGCLVTIDAMGCQKDIAQVLRDEKAD